MSRPVRYDRLVEAALRGVVRSALAEVATSGLSGNQHFYITFRTREPGVKIPDYLAERYPAEMTIVLQYKFYGLQVLDDRFAVTLSFSGQAERLEIPLSAITIFADPSVNFALQFQPARRLEEADDEAAEIEPGAAGDVPTLPPAEARPEKPPPPPGGAEVVSLDQFRKK